MTESTATPETIALLEADCAAEQRRVANFDDEAPIAQWSRGVLRGHQWLEAMWEECVPEDLAEGFAATLMTLSFCSSTSTYGALMTVVRDGDDRDLAAIVAMGAGPRRSESISR